MFYPGEDDTPESVDAARIVALANALREIASAAALRDVDPHVRIAWVGFRADAALAAEEGRWADANLNQRKAEVVSDMLTAHGVARAASALAAQEVAIRAQRNDKR